MADDILTEDELFRLRLRIFNCIRKSPPDRRYHDNDIFLDGKTVMALWSHIKALVDEEVILDADPSTALKADAQGPYLMWKINPLSSLSIRLAALADQFLENS